MWSLCSIRRYLRRKVEERDRIPTDRKENMFELKQYLNFGRARIYPKQTTEGGADFVATTTDPDLP